MCSRWLRLVVLLTILCLLLSGCHRAVLSEDAAPEADTENITVSADEPEAADEPVLSEIVVEDEPVEDVDEDPAEEDPYTGPPPVEPEEVLPEEDFDLVFYFGAAAGGDYAFAIAPEGSEEWVSLDNGWAGTCGNGDVYDYIGIPFSVGKYMLNFTGESGVFWQLRAMDSESGEQANCWHNIPITDNTTRLTLFYSDADGFSPWLGQELLIVDSMLFCAHCPEAWDAEPTIRGETENWPALAFMGETINPFVLNFEMDITPSVEPEGDHLQPDSAFDLVFYGDVVGASRQYCIAPEGHDDMEQPMAIPMPETAQNPLAGACFNYDVHGGQCYQRKWQYDFAGQTSDLWQIRVCSNELILDERLTMVTWHNIPIIGTDTYLRPIDIPGTSHYALFLWVSRAQFCEECPKGWLETNGK